MCLRCSRPVGRSGVSNMVICMSKQLPLIFNRLTQHRHALIPLALEPYPRPVADDPHIAPQSLPTCFACPALGNDFEVLSVEVLEYKWYILRAVMALLAF